jgi:long-chain fatty acid transport protein
MYLAGYGAEANGRGGTNIAVADRALGLQSNPAGIAQLQGNHFSIDIQVLMPDLDYSDPFGNSIEGEDRMFPMPSISYVRGGMGNKWTWGIGLFSQGGMGATFEGYNYPSPPWPPVNNDETFSEVRFASLNPTVAYSFNENISIGLSAILGYSDVQFRFWPGTSSDGGTPPPEITDDFYGMDLTKQAKTFNYAFRLGLMWRATPQWQFGFVYQTKTEGDYDDGELVLNTSGLGDPFPTSVTYGKTAVDGFTWPEQYGAGVQWRPTQKVMIALDVKRYLWSDAMELITLNATEPNVPGFPSPAPLPPFVFQWEDQTVYALGAEGRISEAITLRGGYNHGDSPVPGETLSTLFPATVEDHVTLGLGWTTKKGHTFNFAVERGLENTQTNPTADQFVNPFGPGATVSHSQWTASFGWSWAFSR